MLQFSEQYRLLRVIDPQIAIARTVITWRLKASGAETYLLDSGCCALNTKINGMVYFAVFYTYADDRDAVSRVRPRHREFLASLKDAGHLVGSGPLEDSLTPNALIILRYPDGTATCDVEKVLDQDPYTLNDLLAERVVRPWQVPLNIWE